MGWLPCKCGARISNTLYPSPNQGSVLRQQDEEDFLLKVAADITRFFEAVREGRRSEWTSDQVPAGYVDKSIKDEDVVWDIIWQRYLSLNLEICECQNCGRLYIEEKNAENRFIGFAPDTPGYHSILASCREEKEQATNETIT